MARILVVDDNRGIRALLKEALEKEGYEVITADSRKSAISAINDGFFDLVITDMVMPEHEEIDSIMELKRRFIMPDREGMDTIMSIKDDYPEAKIIAISGGSMGNAVELLEKAKKVGACRVFTKPFKMSDLLDAVNDVIN